MSKQKVMATLLLSTLVLSLSSPLVTLAETINPETSLTMATASTESSSEAEKQEKTQPTDSETASPSAEGSISTEKTEIGTTETSSSNHQVHHINLLPTKMLKHLILLQQHLLLALILQTVVKQTVSQVNQQRLN